jgi:hypothetical protein
MVISSRKKFTESHDQLHPMTTHSRHGAVNEEAGLEVQPEAGKTMTHGMMHVAQ